ERVISQLRLKLMSARSTGELRRIRDEIFIAEQSRWVTPEVSILKSRSHETVRIQRVQNVISPSSVILEYVEAEPRSYCLVITRTSSRIAALPGKQRIDTLVTAYLKAAKAKQPARAEGRRLFNAI